MRNYINDISLEPVDHIKDGEPYHISIDNRPHLGLEDNNLAMVEKLNELITEINKPDGDGTGSVPSIQPLVLASIAALKASDPYSMSIESLTHTQLEQSQAIAAEKINELIRAYNDYY